MADAKPVAGEASGNHQAVDLMHPLDYRQLTRDMVDETIPYPFYHSIIQCREYPAPKLDLFGDPTS